MGRYGDAKPRVQDYGFPVLSDGDIGMRCPDDKLRLVEGT